MSAVHSDDWRRRGQEQYLLGKRLIARAYRPPRPEWDHDHCAFCWATLSLFEGDLSRGYCTEDEYHWICSDCVSDFRDEFRWLID